MQVHGIRDVVFDQILTEQLVDIVQSLALVGLVAKEQYASERLLGVVDAQSGHVVGQELLVDDLAGLFGQKVGDKTLCVGLGVAD